MDPLSTCASKISRDPTISGTIKEKRSNADMISRGARITTPKQEKDENAGKPSSLQFIFPTILL